jgi:hypothetical protein
MPSIDHAHLERRVASIIFEGILEKRGHLRFVPTVDRDCYRQEEAKYDFHRNEVSEIEKKELI